MHKFANEGIDLTQTKLGSAFQIAAHEPVFAYSHLQSGAAGIFRSCHTVLFSQRENALDAAHAQLSLVVINMVAEGANLGPRAFGSQQQLRNLPRSSRRKISLLDAIPAAFLAHVLAEQWAGLGIESADEDLIPLHSN